MTTGLSRLATTIICFLALALVVAGWPRPALAGSDSQVQDEPRQRERHLATGQDGGPGLDGSHSGWFEKFWTRDTMTGDWGGLRTTLHDHGVDLGLRLSQYGQWVTAGGRDQTGQYGGTVDYRLHVDTNKLLGTWKGLSIDVHARTRFGEGVADAPGAFALQNTGLLMPLPGSYHGTDVTGLIATQAFPAYADRIGLFALGKLDIIDTVSLFFPSVDYGQEGFWNINALVSALPWFGAVDGLSLYGGYLATVNQEYGIGESGLVVTGTENVTTSWSIDDSFDDVWIAAFHRFFWKLEDKTGYFMLFAAGSTRDQPSNEPRDFIFHPGQGIVSDDEDNPWDIAAYVYQVFWQAEDDPNRKASILIGGTGGPDNPQFAQWNFIAAVEAYGPIASRPHDRMGVAGWKNWLSDNYKDLLSPVIGLRDTWGVEAYYNVEINPWLHLTANIQVIRNEVRGDSVAVVPGVRLVMDL